MRSRTLSVTVVFALALAAPAAARAGSLPTVASGARPGPDILYEPPATAPQLTTAGVWKAAPILVSGAESYRDGEFLYQDFLYDDHGANGGQRDPNDPRSNGDSFSAPNGTYTYPTDQKRYAENAADLVELRVKPLADATAFRITLNTMLDPDAAATTIAIGNSAGPHPPPPRRPGPAAGPAGLLHRRLPPQGALPDGPRRQLDDERPRLVARPAAGRLAEDRGHEPVLRRRRLRQARRGRHRRLGRPEDRADEPHPGQPLRAHAGRRLHPHLRRRERL